MVPWLKVHTLTEDSSLISSSHFEQLKAACNSSSRRSNVSALFSHLHSWTCIPTGVCANVCECVYTHMHSYTLIHTHGILDYVRENMWYLFFWVLLPFAQSFLVPPFVCFQPDVLLYGWTILHFVSSSVGGNLGWFHNLGVMNKQECVNKKRVHFSSHWLGFFLIGLLILVGSLYILYICLLSDVELYRFSPDGSIFGWV